MREIDKIIKLMLNEIPKTNSESLKTYMISTAMVSRLAKAENSFNNNESYFFNLLNKKSKTNSNKSISRNIKYYNQIINNSDLALIKLFDNLGS